MLVFLLFFFYSKGSETLKRIAQRGDVCLILEDIHGQAGQGSEHPTEL